MNIGDVFNPRRMFVFAPLPEFILRQADVNSSAKIIYAKLIQHANANGIAYPSLETLGEETGMSSQNVRLCLKQLEEREYIRILRPTGRDRLKHYNNQYCFLWHKTMEDAHRPGHIMFIPPEVQPAIPPEVQPASAPNIRSIVEENTLSGPQVRTPTKQKTGNRWTHYANLLAVAISKTKKINRNSHVSKWAKSFELLHRVDGIETPRIKKALLWYCQQLPKRHREEYFLDIQSGQAFREKFLRLENAIAREARLERQERGEDEEYVPTPIAVKVQMSKKEMKKYLDELD